MQRSLKVLFSSILDYAGLFPPAKLGMREAMTNYVDYQKTPESWILSRFVLPVFQLNEWEKLLLTLPSQDGQKTQWLLSTILSGNWEAEIEELFSRKWEDDLAIAALEFPPLSPQEIEKIVDRLPIKTELFWEIPLNDDLEIYLSAIASSKQGGVKIRTGGISDDAFPNITQLCQFVFACHNKRIPFKATAGLHYPLSASNSRAYGFLNLAFLAALIYWNKIKETEAIALLQESSIDAFQFSANSISWRGYQLETLQLQEARQNFFRSFGSCSFIEPVNYLKDLNIL